MARLGWTLSFLLAGCGGKDPTTPTGDDDDDDDAVEETAHTAEPEPDRKLAAEVRFRAFVAWDATLGQVVNPVIDGNDDYISAYIISLHEEGWSDANDDSFCEIVIEIAGTPLAEGVAQEGFLWGIDIPEGVDDKTIGSDCLDKGFDEEQFGGDPALAWAGYDYHMRFGGERSSELEDWLDGDTPTADFDITWFAAGGWWMAEDGGLETDDDSNYWYAYVMDDAHETDLETRMFDFQMTNINGEPVTAYYIFDQRVYWTLDPPTTE